ncbi:MAG: hypothetical protein PHY02_02695 [Phycisphaerae bacterium]|nr:hypothetical protein [Phycisphaerae bacterium]
MKLAGFGVWVDIVLVEGFAYFGTFTPLNALLGKDLQDAQRGIFTYYNTPPFLANRPTNKFSIKPKILLEILTR